MARKQLREGRSADGPRRDEDEAAYSLDIEIDERRGVLEVYDPRAFHAGRRAFCRRLLEAVAAVPDVARAEVDLAAASCRIEFVRHQSTARSMADAFTVAVRRAAETPPALDRLKWWRRPGHWSTLTAFRTPEGVSSWETLYAQPGRIQLRHAPSSGDRARALGLADMLAALDGVEDCRVSPWFGTLTVDYRPGSAIAGRLVDEAELALRHDGAPLSAPAGVDAPAPDGDLIVATGYRRVGYLALAGGSFALTLVGLIVPGVPTVPFLLATSYYLARSSPGLNRYLRRTALFGPILVEWEAFHGLSAPSKARLMALTLAIAAVTVAVSGGSPVVMVVILVIALVSLYGIIRIPGVPADADIAIGADRPARPALAGP
jgi:uncharacterized membrane protein YbaN (DUF454 family)